MVAFSCAAFSPPFSSALLHPHREQMVMSPVAPCRQVSLQSHQGQFTLAVICSLVYKIAAPLTLGPPQKRVNRHTCTIHHTRLI